MGVTTGQANRADDLCRYYNGHPPPSAHLGNTLIHFLKAVFPYHGYVKAPIVWIDKVRRYSWVSSVRVRAHLRA